MKQECTFDKYINSDIIKYHKFISVKQRISGPWWFPPFLKPTISLANRYAGNPGF